MLAPIFSEIKFHVGPHVLRGLSWEEVREWDQIKSFFTQTYLIKIQVG